MKKRIVGVLIAVPLIMILILHIGNLINLILPQLNINPVNIGNIEWFTFMGGYLGGCCTLVTLTYSLDNNNRTSQYQAEIAGIQIQQQIISDVISSLNPSIIHTLLGSIYKLPIVDNCFEQTRLSELYLTIRSEQHTLNKTAIKLAVESNIVVVCDNCKNASACQDIAVRKEFHKKYYEIQIELYQSLNDLYEYLQIKEGNLFAQSIIQTNNRILELQDSFTAAEIAKALDNKVKAEKLLKDDSELTDKIAEHIKILDKIHAEEINVLIGLSKSYIGTQRSNAQKRLKGKPVLSYTPTDTVPKI